MSGYYSVWTFPTSLTDVFASVKIRKDDGTDKTGKVPNMNDYFSLIAVIGMKH